MRMDLDTRLFDLAMLAGELNGRAVPVRRRCHSSRCCPRAGRCWRPTASSCRAGLSRIEATLLPSVWTLFDAEGVARLRDVIESGEVA